MIILIDGLKMGQCSDMISLSTRTTLGIQTRTQVPERDAEAEKKDLQWNTLRGQTTNTHHVSSRLDSKEMTEQQKLDIAITEHCTWSFQGGSTSLYMSLTGKLLQKSWYPLTHPDN